MTRIAFENKISMGNVLTAIGLVLTIAFAWSDLQARQAALERRKTLERGSASRPGLKER